MGPTQAADIVPEQVTVAIEGWNAQDLDSREPFERCLRSLRAQTYPIHRCELLVIVDASIKEQGTIWIKDYLPTATILPVQGATYYRIKNRGIDASKGNVLVFADSDVRYSVRWLEAMIGCLQAGQDLVVGNTQFDDGPFSRTLNLTDWSATRLRSGPTDWLHGNNLAMPRSVFERIRFREDLGTSGGGAVNILREQLSEMGIVPYFCLEARAYHYLASFWLKRLRVGGYPVHYRRMAPETKWSWLARLPLLAPMLVTAGTLLKAFGRAWRLRSTLPLRGLSLPVYLVSISAVRAVEFIGAALVAWAPSWVSDRYGWYDVPDDSPSRPAAVPV